MRGSPAQPGTGKSKQQGGRRVSTYVVHHSRLGKAVAAPKKQEAQATTAALQG